MTDFVSIKRKCLFTHILDTFSACSHGILLEQMSSHSRDHYIKRNIAKTFNIREAKKKKSPNRFH